MKRLMLLRHAKSGDDGMVVRDFDRPLNAKGRRAARAIGRYMCDRALRFDAVIASPAVRVVETLQEVESGYGFDRAAVGQEALPRYRGRVARRGASRAGGGGGYPAGRA